MENITVPTPSGNGQEIVRCAKCKTAVWSMYTVRGLRNHIQFIRVDTLDELDQVLPDVHIYFRSKQPWVILPKEDRWVEVLYKLSETWSSESLERLAIIEALANDAKS